MDAATLITIAKNTKSIANFVCGDGLREAISTIVGDIHLDAAKLAIKTSRISENPRDRINSAITHLEAAHCAYERDHSNTGFLRENTDHMQCKRTKRKDAWVCCLMAMCYAYLNDYRAVRNSLDLAERAIIKLDEEPGSLECLAAIPFLMFSNYLNPRNWDYSDGSPMDTSYTFYEFKAALEDSISR